MFSVTERQPQEKNLVVSFQLLQQIYKTQCWLVCWSLHWFVICQFNRFMQIFSNVIVHSKGFNGSRAFKVVNRIRTYKSCQFQWNTKFVDCKSACNSFHLLLMHTKAVITIFVFVFEHLIRFIKITKSNKMTIYQIKPTSRQNQFYRKQVLLMQKSAMEYQNS